VTAQTQQVDFATSPERRAPSRRRPRIVIAGGGVAALEALIALRDLLDGFVAIDLVAPHQDFVYRPLSVAEPFGLSEPRRFGLRAIAKDHGAELHTGRLVAVNNDQGVAIVRGGPALDYDILFVAVGARPRDWLPGAIHFAGPEDVARLRAVVADLDRGAVGSIVFAAPPGLSWTLPLYELALLTAARVSDCGRGDVRLTVVTPEHTALEVFGPTAARHLRELCANRGIELELGAHAVSFHDGRLELTDGSHVRADRVVALPELEGDPIDGLPHDTAGFIPIDQHGAVRGLPNVYAAGDGVAYPVKQGGLATLQADAAAEAIAARLGVAIEPRPFRPRLRGQLLTGLGPTYLTAGATEAGPRESTVAVNPLWWPPSKIAGRYIAPYLAGRVSIGGPGQLVDRPAVAAPATAKADQNRDGVRDLALDFAELDAAGGDYASALRWLETVEQLDGLLSPALAKKQAEWRERAG
jgi:sulfide:quinone oxidoreductase